jgi:hypothetical protein
MSNHPDWLKTSSAAAKVEMLEYKAKRAGAVKQTPFKASAASDVFKKYEKQLTSNDKAKGASQASIDQFMVLVGELIATDPFMREEHPWAARPQAWWAERLGVSTKQVQRISRAAPVRFLTAMNGDIKMAVYRPGSMADKTPEDYARIMSKMWFKASGRRSTGKEFGLLVGLAKDWPPGKAPYLFDLVLSNWGAFCAGTDKEVYCGMNGQPADHFKAPPEAFVERYWKYPNIAYIRRFWWVALEMLNHDGKAVDSFQLGTYAKGSMKGSG